MFTPAPISHSGMNSFAPVTAPGPPAPNACPSSRHASSSAKPPPKTIAVCICISPIAREASGRRWQWRHPQPIAALLFEPQPRIEALGLHVAVGHLQLQPAAALGGKLRARPRQQRLTDAVATVLRADKQLIDFGHEAAVLETVDQRAQQVADRAIGAAGQPAASIGCGRQEFVQLPAQPRGFKAGNGIVPPVRLDQRQQLPGIRGQCLADFNLVHEPPALSAATNLTRIVPASGSVIAEIAAQSPTAASQHGLGYTAKAYSNSRRGRNSGTSYEGLCAAGH